MIHVHALDGCAPAPLAHYLKALGILRLVAEQADAEARGWWEGERFRLSTRRSLDEIHEFFLQEYRPTPMLAPWNGASGFFRTWDARRKRLRASKNAAAMELILSQPSNRWHAFRAAHRLAIDAVGAVLRERNVDELSGKERGALLIVPKGDGPVFPVADKDRDKSSIQRAMSWSCAGQSFYRSAIVDMGDEFRYPSLWGSGGNDGAIDFTARYFESVAHALLASDARQSENWLCSSLTAVPSSGLLTGAHGKVGQFIPGGAGGANCTTGFGSQGDTLLNPWDFILMAEGAALFAANAARRMDASEKGRAAAPFAVSAQGAGYASAADSDDSARGEQWMPLWQQPMTLAETKRLLAEGRAQIGARPARNPLDLARAVARLGSARGIAAFQRYGYIERNGQSNLAVPLGRFHVPDFASPRLACLDDLDVWLKLLRRQVRDARAPARLQLVERRLADGLFAVAQHPNEASRWQSVLLALADVESVLRTGSGFAAGPVPKLRPEWVGAADDGSPEFRLAVAAALQAAGAQNQGERMDSVRRHWLPLDPKRVGRFATRGSAGQPRLQSSPDVVLAGRSGLDDAIALVSRRLIEAGQRGERHLPLAPARRASAQPSDLARLLSGEVDVDRTMQLARAVMALDSRRWSARPCPTAVAGGDALPDDAWLAIRLAVLPWPLPDGRRIGADPAIVRRLDAGDAGAAVELALRRLRAAGINAAVRVAVATPDSARLWAAALAFPVSRRTAAFFADRLDPNAIDHGELA